MRVSVIISTYGTDRLGDALEAIDSVLCQAGSDAEVLVVIDEDAELRRNLEGRYGPDISVHVSGKKGLSNARNLGTREARGDIIAFLDDDAVACQGWLQAIIRGFSSHPEAEAMTGTIRPRWMGEGCDWLPESLYWMVSCTYMELGTGEYVPTVIGANMAFRRSALEKLGGFDAGLGAVQKWKRSRGGWKVSTGLVGEERDMCIRLRQAGGRILFSRDMCVEHKVYPHRLTMKNLLERAYWEGFSKGYLASRFPGGDALDLEREYFMHLAAGMLRSAGGPATRVRQVCTKLLVAGVAAVGLLSHSIRGVEV